MKYPKHLLLLIAISAALSCKRSDSNTNQLALLDSVPETKYFNTDPFAGKHSGINGIWEVVGTAGGIHGGGYPPDFDLLLVKPNAIFGIVRNDSLLASGKIEIQSDTLSDLLVHFIPGDSLPPTIQILWDYEKYLLLKSDTLVLFSPCCDRYDTILKRVE